MAQQAAATLRWASAPPAHVVFANSSQAGNGSVYGTAKAEASGILRNAAEEVGATFTDITLPNLFGEHGKPFYNSVVATFCHLLQSRGRPEIKEDRELNLLHAQAAADLLLGRLPLDQLNGHTTRISVSELLARLQELSVIYGSGDVPPLATDFELDLFNTYRSFRIGDELPFTLQRRADARGSFFEVCKSHGGSGQTSFSTTAPGVTRGDHYHRRKVERFVVLSGEAEIAMRRLFSNQVLRFKVSGDSPVAIDMPTFWTHNILNTGDRELYTLFWTNDIFDASNPDTTAEKV
ncbi:capsular biosynthesis protein [Pseudarthrobacter sp. C1]|uniref:polysaccharide biosynthesis C-terminal domain-containing protein n=1 Tax=Pseudarthrobacter sp. C1 TaxID=3108940 RepID=UPI002B0595E4|nr:capsular biosynthesis protein [Pseudarthrobacter sp. C1]MEA3550227.1 capsular biosynthesis protein [Pseudarthrobacter sp. C1]